MILPVLAGHLTLGWLISQFVTKPFLTMVSSLDGYLLVFPAGTTAPQETL